ncbi:MAG: C40 family peptidase, partial [Ruminococcus sp.]
DAQQQATEYANLLAAQQAEIEQLEAERIAAEEEARRQAEAAAAAQASDDGNYDSTQHDEEGNAVSSSESSGSGETQYDEYGNVIDSENTVDPSEYQSSSESSSSDSSSSSGSSSSGSGSGSSVVNYATQFVGNPYVWGGTSLTSGADCSGFVQSVYANFGVSLPRTSYEQQNAGTEVSYADAQPGDLICYGGHVAIYMGNGQIVHASNAKDGIKISNNAAYRTITSVRRLV